MEKLCFVFATDDRYAMPTAVAVKTLVKFNKHLIKRIVILYRNSLGSETISLIKLSSLPIEVDFLDVTGIIGYTYDKIPHITAATYYRLAIPILLREEKLCVYLDGDILVRGPLDDFVSTNLGDKFFIAGVKCPSVANSLSSTLKRHAEELEIPNLDSYINAGIQLMNLENMRNARLAEKMISLIPNNYSIQDQDIFNKVCFGNIKLVSPIYNCTTYVFELSKHALMKSYSMDEIMEAKRNPVIVHYASSSKPWKTVGLPFQKEWDYACAEVMGELPTGRSKYKKTTIINKIINRLFKRKR